MKKVNWIGAYLELMPIEKAVELYVWYLVAFKHEGDSYLLNFYATGSKLWANGINYKTVKHKAIVESTTIKALNARMAALDHEFKGDRKLAEPYWFYLEVIQTLYEQA